jgi:hypothetical protein
MKPEVPGDLLGTPILLQLLLDEPDFKFEVLHAVIFAPLMTLDRAAAQQGLPVVDRPRAVSKSRAVWHHPPATKPTTAAGPRN